MPRAVRLQRQCIWVESAYDVVGMRVGLRSSKGLDERIDRNNMGDVVGIKARAGAGEGGRSRRGGRR